MEGLRTALSDALAAGQAERTQLQGRVDAFPQHEEHFLEEEKDISDAVTVCVGCALRANTSS